MNTMLPTINIQLGLITYATQHFVADKSMR